MVGLRPRQEISGSFPDYLRFMLDKPRIRLNNLKTSLKFLCPGLNPIIDSISLGTPLHARTRVTACTNHYMYKNDEQKQALSGGLFRQILAFLFQI